MVESSTIGAANKIGLTSFARAGSGNYS